MKFMFRSLVIVLCLLIIPISAVVTSTIKQRFEDGPNRVFAGGPLINDPIYKGVEPDWEFVNAIDTVELQVLEPPPYLDVFGLLQRRADYLFGQDT